MGAAASFHGQLNAAYLGVDKTLFPKAARWEATKALIACAVISIGVVVAFFAREEGGGPPAPVLIGLIAGCVVIPSLTYLYTMKFVLNWRHDRIRATCKGKAETAERVGKNFDLEDCIFREAEQEQNVRTQSGGGGNNMLATMIGIDLLSTLHKD